MLAFAGCQMQNEKNDSNDFPILMGPYLGQTPPGATPELFAPGIISYGFHELRITFSPDGNRVFFASNRDNPEIILDGSGSSVGKWIFCLKV